MIPQSEQQCENCRFYIQENNECHRKVPSVFHALVDGVVDYWSAWPFVDDHDWCGEWEYTGSRTNP